MEKKELKNKNEQLKVILGTWMGGYCLSHLMLIDAEDATDPDVKRIMTEIKKSYYSGITRGTTITYDDTSALLDALEQEGYDKSELGDMIDNARGRETEYLSTVARLLEQKRTRLLASINYKERGGDKKAENILKTYKVDGVAELKQPAVDVVDNFQKQVEAMQGVEPISAGTEAINRITGGFRPGQLVAIGARPGVGKTAFCLQIAEQVAKAGKKVLHIPLEMTAEEMLGRQIYRETKGQITVDKLNDIKSLSPEDKKAFELAANSLRKLTSTNLLYIPGERELNGIKRQIELHNPDLVVIDQLTLLEDATYMNAEGTIRMKYKHAVETLKEMALDYNIVIVLAAQLNREGVKNGGVPSMINFKEAGSIEESADVCFILHKPQDDNESEYSPDSAELILKIDKFRGGPAGGYFKLTYNYRSQIFSDIPGGSTGVQSNSHFSEVPKDEYLPF